MGRRALILRSRDGRAAFDPDRAPHRALVRELLIAQLPPLHARLRGAIVDDLVRRIVTIEQSPVPLVEESPSGQLAIVALRVQQAIRELETEERAVVRAFRAFSDLHATLDDPALRRRLLAEYLAEKVRDRRQLEGDLAALDRHLGYDALRERHLRIVLGMSAQVEEGLHFLAGAVGALVRDPGDGLVERVVDARLVELCATRLVHGTRWQVRFAAGRALVAVAEALAGSVGPAALELIDQTATNLEEHPWVQAAALEAGVLLGGDAGRARLVERLTSPRPGKDLFVRALAIRIATRRLPTDEGAALIARLVAGADPSEHVRMTLVEAAAELGWPAAEPHLAALGGLIRPREPSARVRATVAIVTRRLAASAATAGELVEARGAAELLAAMTGGDLPFTLLTVCEELASLAGELAATAPALLAELAPSWIEALDAVVADEATAPRIAEAAAGAAEAIDRERDPIRRQLTTALGEACAAIPPGGAGVVALGALPDELAEAARDDAQLGRVLADLTRRDWGVSATRRGDRLRLWRGDRFRRRLWRVLHELRNPLPNKRQAWVHTVGRDYPGEVRAHPGLLDEATATTVPGERVTVDDEGSWCRHLPMVDDLLDLPVTRARPVRVVSSLGVALVEPPAALWKRIRNRFAIAARYRTLAGLRLASLRAPRDRQRRRYIETLARDFDIKVQLLPHARPDGVAPLPPGAAELFAEPATASPPPIVAAGAGTALALAGPVVWLRDFLDVNRYYFESPTQNSQTALVAFGAALSGLFFTAGWAKRRRIDRARAAIPLTIGGWGTRGKSGTERLKAALFDGLGFEVFVKTTGCEAMFIHSAPMQQPVEIFIYRPYDKATIWEQRAMLELGARLRTDVFLWECMALNPKYVQLLQHDWMHDDLVTLTNCYPDHEDIQGPVGFNVAQVITEFIPTRSVLVTSETSYLPMFTEVARKRGTPMYTIGERDAELIPDDVLDLYPYREHPRNIALVTRVAAELGLERDLAWLTMAEYVVPDLGVLKSYPKVRVRGRLLTFVCGNSANERTGFINNWRRIKLDRLDLAREPHRLVITVVNNRADRISRSEVFARILVRDVAFDRHVLIGTNLKGLRGFIDVALDDYLRELDLVEAAELAPGEVPVTVATRLVRELGKLRIPPATAEVALVRLGVFAGGAGRRVSLEAWPALAEALGARLDGDPDGSVDVHAVRAALTRDRELATRLDTALVAITDAEVDEHPETLEPATVADALEHFVADLARMVVRGRLEARLRRLFDRPSEPARRAFAADFASAYRTMFLAQVEVIDDAGASGDQIIDRCARCVPPGTDVTLMGTQNIKGTGLDFVYRWLAVDKVVTCLREQTSQRLDKRSAALAELEGFEDHGLVDAGLARALLARPAPHPPTSDEEAARQRLKTKVEQIWQKRRKGLVEARRSGLLDRVAAWGEGWLDWADSVRRTHQARQITDDLVAHRISHGRASVEMRKLVGRLKGGWLAKALRRSSSG